MSGGRLDAICYQKFWRQSKSIFSIQPHELKRYETRIIEVGAHFPKFPTQQFVHLSTQIHSL